MPQAQADESSELQAVDCGGKDEAAVNHEIATLLLNLASRTQTSEPVYISKPEINTIQNTSTIVTPEFEAMDLSICSKPICETSSNGDKTKPHKPNNSSSICSSVVNSNFHKSSISVPTSVNPYCLFTPNLANNPMAGLGSTYLLQNLLLGKMHQQIAANTNSTYSTGSSQCCGGLSSPISSSSTFSNPVLNSHTTTSIPLLSGQIVAQLNGLLFMVHGLTDKTIEVNIQGQLAAIYTRLQEIVAMVDLTKQKDSKNESKDPEESSCQSPQLLQKTHNLNPKSEFVKGVKQKEEESITRQLEEYQKALVHSQTPEESQLLVGSFGNGAVSSSALNNQNGADTVKPNANPTGLVLSSVDTDDSPADSSSISASAAARRRRGRPPKDNISPYESPPDKRSRESPEIINNAGSTPTSTSLAPRPKSGKGGKGIRNRVFCGDCPGCLKNDDCGQCRYCRDKTKFGGQNRLRQKCLHRRCQMDTHRRSSSTNPAVTTQSLTITPTTSSNQSQIYGGVELARLANTQQININTETRENKYISGSLSPGEIIRSPSGHPIYTSFLSNPSLLTPVSKAHLTDVSQKEAPLTNTLLEQYQIQNGNQLIVTGGGSDEDTDEGEERRPLISQQSRIDKWKAKHEAMLKMVQNTEHKPKNKQVGHKKFRDEAQKLEKYIDNKPFYSETIETNCRSSSPTHVTSSHKIIKNLNSQNEVSHFKVTNNVIHSNSNSINDFSSENNKNIFSDNNKDSKITQSNNFSNKQEKTIDSAKGISHSNERNNINQQYESKKYVHDLDIQHESNENKQQVKTKQETGRLTTRSMKTVVAV